MESTRLPAMIAAATGLAVALAGAIAPAPPSPFAVAVAEGEIVARVNGAPIARDALAHAVARAGADPRRALPAPPGAGLALDRLVEEELLVQRAFEMGFVESDRAVRKALARAAIDDALAEAEAREPSEAALRAFHAENEALFGTPRRARVRSIRFADAGGASAAAASDTAERRAETAAAAIREGIPFEEAARRFGDEPGLPVPDALLPEAALRRHLGPVLADAALALPPGGVSEPLRAADGLVLLQLAESRPAAAAPFEAVREAVRAAYARRADEETVDALLVRLRDRARIELAPDAPRP